MGRVRRGAGGDTEVIFVRWFRHPKTGRRIYASAFGKAAFPIRVRSKPR